MPISLDSSVRSREDEKGNSWPERGDWEIRDIPKEETNHSDGTQFIDKFQQAYERDSHLAVQDVRQLPSPSPTPSPRSISPSLTVSVSAKEVGNSSTLSPRSRGNSHSESFAKSRQNFGTGANEETLVSPLPISKTLPSLELHDIPEEKIGKTRRTSASKSPTDDKILKLSASEITELTSAPESLPVSPSRGPSSTGVPMLAPSPVIERRGSASDASRPKLDEQKKHDSRRGTVGMEALKIDPHIDRRLGGPEISSAPASIHKRPGFSSRAISTPPIASNRMSSYSKTPLGQVSQTSPKRKAVHPGSRPEYLDLNSIRTPVAAGKPPVPDLPSPLPQSIPLPPMSIPTYLQLELSSTRPSPLYIFRSAASEFPYESSQIKFERLLNFLLLPPQLEQVLFFGSFACLDALLYTFTILPLRFFKALAVLVGWWFQVIAKEARFIGGFVWHGTRRMWDRQRDRSGSSTGSPTRSRSASRVRRPATSTNPSYQSQPLRTPSTNPSMDQFKAELERKSRQGWTRKHRRTKSQPSTLSSNHKADLLQGAVIICSCIILLEFDASRMYHSIKGQAAIKLYVIYNLLEVSRTT